MAGVVTVKLLDALKDIGVDVSQKQGSNVKTLATKNKSSATKPGLLASERDTGGNFGTVLDIFKKEAQFIEGMNDVEQMAFLNNIMDYNEFGGKSIKVSQGQKLKDEFDEGLGTLKDDIESLQDKAKTMKDEAEVNLKSSEKDLDDFISTGGQPLKAKSDKYLGGSMHEEGQLRTAIRTFLKNEYKNGKIKLDETDQFRIMEYSPMMEDDPIKVFKKIYGDEAYNKAGTFPGAFEKGENFNHYELIFKENMGEDLLKVKDKKYTGDGTLVLTKQEEVFEPTPDVDDDGIPFAKGGRASFAGGKLVDEFIAMIVKKEPIDAMKEVNKVIGKKGKYKNLTQKDIDRIVEGTEDWIFQRDPDNLYVKDRPMFKQKDETVDDMQKEGVFMEDGKTPDYDYYKEILDDAEDSMGFNVAGDETIEELLKREKTLKDYEADMYDQYKIGKLDPEPGSKSQARLNLLKKRQEEAELTKDYRLFSRDDAEELDELEKFFEQDYKRVKAEQADEMSLEESLTTLEGLGGTKMAERFRLKQKYPGLDDDLLTNIIEDTDPVHRASVLAKIDMAMELGKTNKSAEEIIDILKKEPETKMATGGRAGFMDGGASIINPESSMNNSSGLNYLLGEDDNSRVDFKNGLLVPPSKPKKPQDPMMKLMETYNTYQEALPGVSQETKKYLEQDFIKKLADQGFSINDFMTYRMQQNYANGGRAAFGGGGTMGKEDRGYQGGGRNKKGNVSGTAPGAAEVGGGPDDRGNDRQNEVQAMVNAGYTAKEINSITNPSAIDKIKSSRYNTPLTRGILKTGAYMYNPMILGTELRDLMKLKNLYDETQKESLTYGLPEVMNPEYGMEDLTYGVPTEYATGGRAGYEEGGPIHSRLGELNTGVSSAEQQLQQINQSIEQAQSTLGSAESGGGGASAVTPSVSGYESSGSELYDSSPAGEVTNPYVAPVGMNSLPSKPDNKFSNSGGISILDDPRYESSISGPENIMPSMPVNSSPFDMLDPSITNLNQLGPGKIDNQGQDPFRDPVTGGGQPSYGPGGGLGGLLGEGGGLPNIPKMPIRPMPMPDLGPPDPDAYLYQADGTKIYPNRPQPIDQMPMLSPDTPNSPFGNIMQATPSTGGGPSLTQTAISGGGVMPRPGPAIDPNNPLLQLQNSMNAGKLPGNNTLQAAANSNTGPVYYINGNTGEKIYNKPGAKQPVSNFTPEQIQFMQMTLRGSAPSALSDRPIFAPGPVQQLADGGIAGLRQGYAGGSLVDKGRRGFLKFLGGTAAGVVALKTGLAKILGKDSGAVSKKVIDEVIIDGGSGAPAWLQPLVNKALREGTDITKNNALKDGQVVKSLDTPTGKVDVYYDTRTGEVDVDYIGGNTALGESVNMRYTPGIADEGTKGVKPADEFEAVERIPEQTMFGVDDYELTMGENAVGDVKGLYSDTSELAELGGEKLLIKDISESIKKKKVLKQMGEDPTEFATEGYSTGQYYDPT